jgi:hypothetical protein
MAVLRAISRAVLQNRVEIAAFSRDGRLFQSVPQRDSAEYEAGKALGCQSRAMLIV